MPDYYFDVETKGTKSSDELLTIQYMPMNCGSGESKGELVILKAWESSEKEIVTQFFDIFQPNAENPFIFVPVGENLTFDFMVLWNAWKRAGIDVSLENMFRNRPRVDIKSDCVRMNGGNFKGASLTMLFGTHVAGRDVPIWYADGNYQAIVDYIHAETKEFLRYYKMALPYFRNMRQLMQRRAAND